MLTSVLSARNVSCNSLLRFRIAISFWRFELDVSVLAFTVAITLGAGQVQLRRHLHSGFAASLQYTYSKAIDDASLGGAIGQGPQVIAQDWENLKAERALSSFDQRNLLSASLQYTSGMGKSGVTTMRGWQGKLLRDWTAATQISSGTGLPETPIYFTAVQGTV